MASVVAPHPPPADRTVNTIPAPAPPTPLGQMRCSTPDRSDAIALFSR